MAGFDEQKATQELETAKAKLKDTNCSIRELQSKIQQLQQERKANISQHQKKMKNLTNLQSTQFNRLAKLDADLNNTEKVLQSRMTDHESLAKLYADNQKALNDIRYETDAMVANSQKNCHELEESINEGYLQIQIDKDMEVLFESCQNVLKTGTALPCLSQILKRRQDIYKQLAQLKTLHAAVTTEMTARQQNLAAAKEKHSSLKSRYLTLKTLKEDQPDATDPSPPSPPSES